MRRKFFFVPLIDHFMQNETAQIINYITKVASHGAGPGGFSGDFAIIESTEK